MAETTLAPNWVRPAQGQWTYADYLHLPDDGKRYEIIDGVLRMSRFNLSLLKGLTWSRAVCLSKIF